MKRHTDPRFIDDLIEQPESLLENLHISVEFTPGCANQDDDERSSCSTWSAGSDLTSSTKATNDPNVDEDWLFLSGEEEEFLMNGILKASSSTASTYFFTLKGTMAEF
jgi:hypothetical protein